MKNRFSTLDIAVATKELEGYIGLRVVNVYDIDNKTYLIKLQKPDSKAVILIESGIRIQSTEFDWPKNPAPSGFSMKLRKHLKNRRLESIVQLGVDRIVDLTFGSGEAAFHLIVELYDRGNIVLTDVEYNILNILRPRADDNHDVRFAVREKYPINVAKEHSVLTEQRLRDVVSSAKENDVLKKVLIPHLDYGPAVIDHSLREVGFPENVKIGKGFNKTEDFSKLKAAVENAELLFRNLTSLTSKGYIIQKREKRPNAKEGEPQELLTYEEFHPHLFKQHEGRSFLEFDTFNKAVDEFFSQQESQKLDMKILHQEKSALKKLDNIKKDHVKRLDSLQKEQELDKVKAELIELNLPMVEQALLIVRSAVANQIDWTEIWNIVQEAQAQGDPVACAIKGLKLDSNQFTMLLRDPYVTSDDEDDDRVTKPLKIDIDLSLSAYSNSRKYFEQKRHAGKKEQKTVDSSAKALKSAERKTKELLKDVQTAATINKLRKVYWFEKFLWFITSENFLVIGGRDSQQNELIVKRYFRPGDLYVHADLHGASSVIIKNPTGEPVPPKSLNEAGTMALCNSAAWDAKVVTSAWWVHHEQVSKTAPTGEYLTTGSFMIRGKKNYLPPSHLIYGFGILFKLEEGSIFRHEGERRVRGLDDDDMSVISSLATESELGTEGTNSAENSDSEDSDSDDDNTTDSNSIVLTPIDEGGSNAPSDMDSDSEDIIKQDSESTGNKEENNSKDTEDSAFPDTDLKLQHVRGDKFEFQRSVSHPEENCETMQSVTETNEEKIPGKAKLSAKQRREQRKNKKGMQSLNTPEADEEDKVSWLNQEDVKTKNERVGRDVQDERNPEQQKVKRGQKAKMKKIKEKYADQDDEERRLKMEILCSSGAQSEAKKKRARKALAQMQNKGKTNQPKKRRPENVMEQYSHISYEDSKNIEDLKDLVIKDNPEIEEDEKELESHPITDDLQLLTSLTGCPLDEDEILYTVPVCAPYSTLLNYKYKVKLLPGTTKKGKATKNSLNNFLHDKAITSREKDLLRILKDVDISRNIPGKVKIATPIVRKTKK